MVSESSRQGRGQKISIFTAVGNILLFGGYFIIGTIGNSITVISEGVDNLMDACGSLLLLLGFKISGREKDSRHPNGHGRMEYIVGLLISEIVLFAAVIVGKESVRRLFHPEPVRALFPILLAAVIGAGVKLVLAVYIKKQNLQMQSPALEAYRKNELADLKGIILVAVSPVLQHFTTLPVDGVAGIAIAVMIAVDGAKSFMRNTSLLLGEGLGKEESEVIMQLLRPYGDAIQLESFAFHDYGPEEKEGILVLSITPGIPYDTLQQIVNGCKEQIKNRLNIQVFVYFNLNKANAMGRIRGKQPHFGGVRRYLRLLTRNART